MNDWKTKFTAAVLALLGLLLFTHQYVTMALFKVFPPGAGFGTFSRFLSAIEKNIAFGWADYTLGTAILGCVVYVVISEIRGTHLTLLLRQMVSNDRRTMIVLAAGSFIAVRFYVGTGIFSWGADQPQHITFAHMASRSISEGELPIWTNYYGTGTPYLQFYGFLFFYLVALVDQLWHNISVSLKSVMAIMHVASGVAMYILARTVTRSRIAGFIAGAAYVLSFWHTQQVSIMGRFPLSLFYALLPLPFYFFERVATKRPPLLNSLLGGICMGSLALTHPGYGFWASVFFALYVAIRLLSLDTKSLNRGTLSQWSALIFAGGLIFGGYLTLPMWLDREYTGLYRGLVNLASVPIPTWQHVFAWSNFRFWSIPPPDTNVNWYGGYIGLSLVAIVATGMFAALRSRSRRLILVCLPAVSCLAITLIFVFAYRWSLLQALPVVKILGAGRYLLFTVFFLALASAFATRTLMIVLKRHHWRIPVQTMIVIAIVIDLGPTTFQQPYFRDLGQKDTFGNPLSLYEKLREPADLLDSSGELPNRRVFWSHSQSHYVVLGQLYIHSLTPNPNAFHPGDSRVVSDFVKPIEEYLAVALPELARTQTDSPDGFPDKIFNRTHLDIIRSAFSMLNVRYVIVSQPKHQATISESNTECPVLVSPTLTPFTTNRLYELVKSGEIQAPMKSQGLSSHVTKVLTEAYPALFLTVNSGINANTQTCDRIFAMNTTERRLGTQPEVEVLEHTVRTQHVRLRIQVTDACFARLSYAYYPYLRVLVDNQEVEPFRTAAGFLAVELEAGEHTIELEPYLSPLRRGFLAFNLFYLSAIIVLFVRSIWRR